MATCIVTGKGFRGVMDFATGVHCIGSPRDRDLEQIAADGRTKVVELNHQIQLTKAETKEFHDGIDREFDDLCQRANRGSEERRLHMEILEKALAEAEEVMADIDAIAEDLNPHRPNQPR